MTLGDQIRLREEDPFTDLLVSVGGSELVVGRSRFEIDVNRSRDQAVYAGPASAWGLSIWNEPLPDVEVEASLAMHDDFYRALADELDALARKGAFLVFDVHSYNHRRAGPDAVAAPPLDNPEVNVGTGSLDRDRWSGLVDRFVHELRDQEVCGHRLDVRENIRFRGGHLSGWINERYDGTGCALALEFKKTFMDEWTGVPDLAHLRQLRAGLEHVAASMTSEMAASRS
jgi:N-formylglutamate amidohydrolase